MVMTENKQKDTSCFIWMIPLCWYHWYHLAGIFIRIPLIWYLWYHLIGICFAVKVSPMWYFLCKWNGKYHLVGVKCITLLVFKWKLGENKKISSCRYSFWYHLSGMKSAVLYHLCGILKMVWGKVSPWWYYITLLAFICVWNVPSIYGIFYDITLLVWNWGFYTIKVVLFFMGENFMKRKWYEWEPSWC